MYSKFTGEHSCRSAISIKLLCDFHTSARCSPVNLLHIFRTLLLKNTSGWLLLTVQFSIINIRKCSILHHFIFNSLKQLLFSKNYEKLSNGKNHSNTFMIINWLKFIASTKNPVKPRKLNVHKTFRRRPGRLVNVLCTFNLRPGSTGNLKDEYLIIKGSAQKRSNIFVFLFENICKCQDF